MAVQVSYPGVYIDEFAPGAPIEGVGTSTAAFLGPISDGPLNIPTKITSWEAFLKLFGNEPLDGFYLWYAVRGFFENGGQVCYVARVSNGKFDSYDLEDRNSGGAKKTIRLQARVLSDNSANRIRVTTSEAHAVNAKLFRPIAAVDHASGGVIQVTNIAIPDAFKFLTGNAVVIEGGGKVDSGIVQSIENGLIRLKANLTNSYALADNATVRLANLKSGVDNTFRVVDGGNLASGSVIIITQVKGGGITTTEPPQIVKSVSAEYISSTLTTYRVVLKKELANDFVLNAAANDVLVVSQEFKLTVTQGTYTSPIYDNLSMVPGHPRYFASIINSDPDGRVLAAAVEPPNTTSPPKNRPRDYTDQQLNLGAKESNLTLTVQDYLVALKSFEAIDDINIIAIPDRADDGVQQAMIAHCEKLQDRFAILDSRRGAPLFGAGSVEEQRHSVDSKSGYAALYYPWIRVSPISGSAPVLVPPSGHVAGTFARIDNSRGVHKAPAGTEALVNGALGVEQTMSDIDQGELNKRLNINVIRVFQTGGRPVVWGARTTATDTNWQYVNIRRLFIFIEKSIQRGIRGSVFEPNNLELWQKLKRTISAFLAQQWRDGALFGATEKDAFYVRIDEVINPPDQRALGRLNIEIGVKPAYPAEFIVVRIGIWQGGSDITE